MNRAENILTKVSGQSTHEEQGRIYRGMTLRGDPAVIASINAIAEITGEPKTGTASAMASLGIQEVEKHMTSETLARYHELCIKDLQNWRKEQEAE